MPTMNSACLAAFFMQPLSTIFGWPRARAEHAGEAALSQCAQLIKELSYIFWCEKQQQQHCRASAIKRSSDALTIISDVIKVKAIQCFPTGDFSYFRGIIIAMPMNQSTAQILYTSITIHSYGEVEVGQLDSQE